MENKWDRKVTDITETRWHLSKASTREAPACEKRDKKDEADGQETKMK